MKYSLVRAEAPEILIEIVNQAIQNGWQPLGGVAVAIIPNPLGEPFAPAREYLQALIAYPPGAAPSAPDGQAR